jgi:hypothetical protein
MGMALIPPFEATTIRKKESGDSPFTRIVAAILRSMSIYLSAATNARTAVNRRVIL